MAQKTDIETSQSPLQLFLREHSLVSHPLNTPIDAENLFDSFCPLPTYYLNNVRQTVKNPIRIAFHTKLPGEIFCEHRELVAEMVQRGLQQLSSGLPIVYCSPPHEGQFLFTVCCITEKLQNLGFSGPDLISSHLPSGVSVTSSSMYRVVFSVDALLDRQFLFIYNAVAFENHESFRILNEQSSAIHDAITFSLKLPLLWQQTRTILATHPHKAAHHLLKKAIHWLARHRSSAPAALLLEVQRFLLATDEDFQGIRTPEHLLKLVSSHLWLKKMHSHLTTTHSSEKWFYYRVFRSKLHFPFGTKEVISLAISLHSLSTYEQFDHRHILLACKRCLPCLDAVPRSFYMYRYSEEPTLSLYLELEKHDDSQLTAAEMTILKQDLGHELAASIEQVMSRIDIPQNEEDLLRNFLLLAQQIRTTKCLPQVIVQFQGQTDSSLEFHITLVRAVKKGEEIVPTPSSLPKDILRCALLRTSIIDTLKNTYLKQGIVFLVECSKEYFLRRDRSVDFLKARESVIRCIESVFGGVRDLNGGLIYQHHQLLDTVLPLLTKEEAKEFSVIEDLFHSLSPSSMKNILGPEHVVTLFRQLQTLRSCLQPPLTIHPSIQKFFDHGQHEKHGPPHISGVDIALRQKYETESSSPISRGKAVSRRSKGQKTFLVEDYAKEVFIGFICPPFFAKEEVFQEHLSSPQTDGELAMCDIVVEGHRICFVIYLNKDKKMRDLFTKRLQAKVNEKQKTREKKSLRISLSRPTISLDPRIGTDRTSGTVIKMLYEGLMRLDPTGTPTPAVAEEVLMSDDGMTYTFKLRSTYWTNGLQVTAYDFEYSWKKILEPSFQTVFDYLLHPILNARLVKAGHLSTDALGIHALNETTLVVHLEKPAPHFLELCCLWIYSPLCKDIDKTHPGWAYYGDRTYVCNGPFKLTKRERNGNIQLVKNNSYWDKDHVEIEEIDIKVIEDAQLALKLFEQGALDWLGEPLSETPLCLFKETNPRVHTQPMDAVQWYDLNVLHPPFRSKKVRQAFSYALDRQALIKEVVFGDERPSNSILPPSLSLLDNHPPLDFDLEKARTLFAEGMEEQGLIDSVLKPLTMVVYDQEPHKSIARAVIRSWEEAFGLSFILEVVSWHEFFERVGGTSHDIIGHVWYSWYKDPLYSLKILQSATNSMNSSRWSDEKYAWLLEKAEGEIEKHKRCQLLRSAEELVMNEMPIVPVFEYTSRYLKSAYIDNVYVSHLGNVDFKWTTFDSHKGHSVLPLETSPSLREPLPPLEIPSSDPDALLHDDEPLTTLSRLRRPSRASEIRLYLQTEPVSLDPRVGGDKRTQVVMRELYEGLMRIGKHGELEHALAESVFLSDNQMVYTFHLRPSKWSNGSDLTAEDFEWTIKTSISPHFSTPYAFAFFSIQNARKANNGECSLDEVGVVAKDRLTLQITLERPVPYFLELTSNPIYSPVCKECTIHVPQWSSTTFPTYVSNGPFLLKSHIANTEILLEKNPYYWDSDGAKSEHLSFSIIKDPKTAFYMFESGELDWYGDPCGNMSRENFAKVKMTKGLIQRQGGGTTWLVCRTDTPHLRSAKIRRAIALAINRREICDALLQEGEYPALSFLLPFHSLCDRSFLIDNDPQIAKSLFDEGLQEEGMTKRSYPSLVISHSADEKSTTIVKILQKQLKSALGIQVISSLLDGTTYGKRFAEGNFQMTLANFFSWIDDPIFTLQFLKHSKNKSNGTAWEDPEYTHLLNLSDVTKDTTVRRDLLKRAEEIAMSQLPVIPLFYTTDNYAKAPNLSGEVVSPVGLVEMKWLEKNSLPSR